MDNKYNSKDEWRLFGGYLVVLIVLIALCLCSCTRKVYVNTETVRTEYQDRLLTQTDSVFVHDSVMIDRSKDTILIERWHTLYRDRAKIDSVYINKVDSIPYPVTVEKQVTVEKKLTWWQKARLYLANVTIAALLIVGAYLLVRWYLRKKIPNI